MADAVQKEPFGFAFPLWTVVGRRLWLDGHSGCYVLIGVRDIGLVLPFFTDEHQAIEFLDDANNPEWCTIMIRDAVQYLTVLKVHQAVGVKDVALDLAYPGGPHERIAWFIPIQHAIDRASPSNGA